MRDRNCKAAELVVLEGVRSRVADNSKRGRKERGGVKERRAAHEGSVSSRDIVWL